MPEFRYNAKRRMSVAIANQLRSPSFHTRISTALAASGLNAAVESQTQRYVEQALAAVGWSENPDALKWASLEPTDVANAIVALAEAGLPYDPKSRVTSITSTQ